MKIAIVDDLIDEQKKLIQLLDKYFLAKNILAEYYTYNDSNIFLNDFIPNNFSIIFLDIYIDNNTGIDIAKKIYETDKHCKIIFSTVSELHAVKSYSVNATYYLTKPVDYTLLCEAIDKACADLIKDNRFYTFLVNGVNLNLLLKNIMYIDCSMSTVRVHLNDKTLCIDGHVSDVINSLMVEDERFLYCNKNILVNMDYIEKILANDFALIDGTTIPIKCRSKNAIKKIYLNYSLNNLQRSDL